MLIADGADPVVISNTIHDSDSTGVLVRGAATKGRLEQNVVWGNKEGGIGVYAGSDPILLGNTIREHARRGGQRSSGIGLYIAESARGRVALGVGNVFTSNEGGDVVRA